MPKIMSVNSNTSAINTALQKADSSNDSMLSRSKPMINITQLDNQLGSSEQDEKSPDVLKFDKTIKVDKTDVNNL